MPAKEINVDPTPYQWIGEDGGHRVGRIVTIKFIDNSLSSAVFLMWEPMGNVFSYVPTNEVNVYPSSPIEQPTK